MPAKIKTKPRARYRRRAIDAEVVAEIDSLVKSGRYPSRIAVLEAAFAALRREKALARIKGVKRGLPPTVARLAGTVKGRGITATNAAVAK